MKLYFILITILFFAMFVQSASIKVRREAQTTTVNLLNLINELLHGPAATQKPSHDVFGK